MNGQTHPGPRKQGRDPFAGGTNLRCSCFPSPNGFDHCLVGPSVFFLTMTNMMTMMTGICHGSCASNSKEKVGSPLPVTPAHPPGLVLAEVHQGRCERYRARDILHLAPFPRKGCTLRHEGKHFFCVCLGHGPHFILASRFDGHRPTNSAPTSRALGASYGCPHWAVSQRLSS